MKILFLLFLPIVLVPLEYHTVQASVISATLLNSKQEVVAPGNIDPSTIVYNDEVCLSNGDNISLCFEAAAGATEYVFNLPQSLSINGMSGTQPITVPAQNGGIGQQCFTLDVIAPNSGSVCVTPQNSSGQADMVCLSFTVINIPITVLAPIRACVNKTFVWSVNNVTYLPPATMVATLTSQGGCDSIVTQQIIPVSISPTVISEPFHICVGDTMVIEEEEIYRGGTYSHIYINAIGCDSMVIFTVLENDAQAFITQDGSIDCQVGSTLQLDASQSYTRNAPTYEWYLNGELLGTDITLTPRVTGQYELIVISKADDDSCVDQATIDVVFPSIDLGLQIDAGTGVLTCTQLILDIALHTPVSNTTFQWIGPDNFESLSQNIQVDQPGLYKVKVTNPAGCTDEAEILIDKDEELKIDNVGTTAVSCFGEADGCAQVNGISGVSPFSFIWSDGQVSSSTNCNLAAGQYTVTVEDGNGCLGVHDVFIDEPDSLRVYQYVRKPIINYQDGVIVPMISGGTRPYAIELTDENGMSMPNLYALGAGNYQLTITDANGCTFSTLINLPWNNTIRTGRHPEEMVFPNPFRRQTLIQWPSDLDVRSVEVNNLSGQRVIVQPIDVGSTEWSLDMSHLPQGSYQLLIHTSTEVIVYPDLLLKQ